MSKQPSLLAQQKSIINDAKKNKGQSFTVNSAMWKIPIILIITGIVWALPETFWGIPDLTIVEHRTIAIFVFAALMWLLEAVPAWTTSVTVTALLLLTCSTSGIKPLMEVENIGCIRDNIIPYKDLMFTFADPIVMLFLGGFILAIAASKVGLDMQLSRILLKPFGKKSHIVLLGFLLLTAGFSMFMSNTATAAMMLTFMAPVLSNLPADGKGRVALALSIPVAANVGGMGTPIGTPPNAIALKYMNEMGLDIGFGQWCAIMIPFVLVIIVISWLIMLKLYPFSQKEIDIVIPEQEEKNPHKYIVYITFAATIILWMLDKFTGINSNTVAMLPIAVFALTGVITPKDLSQINWSVLWMVAGGFALGVAMKETGLAQNLVENIPFGEWSPLIVLICSGIICWLLSNFISNTATAALLVPILASVATGMGDTLTPVGGATTVLVGIAISASFAMMLPISTPPNALAYSSGLVEQKDMIKIGVIVGLLGLIAGYGMLIFIGI